MKEEELAVLNQARSADLLLKNIQPVLEKKRRDLIAAHKSDYRMGALTEAKAFAFCAALCALDDLENQLLSRYRKGEKLLEEYENGRLDER